LTRWLTRRFQPGATRRRCNEKSYSNRLKKQPELLFTRDIMKAMSFWRRDVIEHALDRETEKATTEQLAWMLKEPQNPRPYFHLAQLLRMKSEPDKALGLLLESVRLDPAFAEAHVALSEMYAVQEDYTAAWRHARLGEQSGNAGAVELLKRYGIEER